MKVWSSESNAESHSGTAESRQSSPTGNGIKYSKQFALNKQAQKVKYVATDIVAEDDNTQQGGGDNGGGGDNNPPGELEG